MDRTPQPNADDEAGVLLGWLNFHRDALAAKCEGMTAEQMVTASAPPSSLTLIGLVRHLTEMERHYIVRAFSGADIGLNYVTDEDEEADIENLDVSMVDDSMRRWHEERAAADTLIAANSDLSATAATGWGSIRALLVKVLQEYARHNGHADIIRERIDGARGE
jgi:hypothetical protein